MKLRLRDRDSPAILPIDFSGEASLSRLRHYVAQVTQNPAPPPSSIRLSLNGADELRASSDGVSLAALGISSGDFVYYSLSDFDPAAAPIVRASPVAEDSDSDYLSTDYDSSEEESEDDVEIPEGSCRSPESCFVRRLARVLRREFRYEGFEQLLIALSVHCVLLESGFVRFESASGKVIRGDVGSMASAMSLDYSLPAGLEEDERPFVVVKFSRMEPFVNLFAFLDNGGSGSATYRLCLDERRFTPAICTVANGVGNWVQDSVEVLSELWRIVRDEVALPLMSDLCAKAGLPGPACLSRLPSELLMKILEVLPGNDIARVGCTCKELRNLASDNELWRRKFWAEFGLEIGRASWKDAFGEFRRRRRLAVVEEQVAAVARRVSRVWRSGPVPPPFGFGSLLHYNQFVLPRERLPIPGRFLPQPYWLPNPYRDSLGRVPFLRFHHTDCRF